MFGKNVHLAATAGAFGPPIYDLIDGFLNGDIAGAVGNVAEGYTSFNPVTGEQNFARPMIYYGSAIIGGLASKYIGKVVNKYTPKGWNI